MGAGAYNRRMKQFMVAALMALAAVPFAAQNSRTQSADQSLQLKNLDNIEPLVRHATKPTRGSQRRRVETKVKHGLTKRNRRRVSASDA